MDKRSFGTEIMYVQLQNHVLMIQMIVTEKGAKYIVIKDEAEEEKMKGTYISLKIKTKGKRSVCNSVWIYIAEGLELRKCDVKPV